MITKVSTVHHLRMMAVLCLFLLAGCQIYKPAITSNPTEIKNPTIGLNGYTLHIPPGFILCDISENMRKRFAMQEAGFVEEYQLENETMSILFVACLEGVNFGRATERRLKDCLYHGVEKYYHPKDAVNFNLSYIRMIPNHIAAKITYLDPKKEIAWEIRIIPGRMEDAYYILGRAAAQNAQQMTETMDVMCKSFEY